MTPAPALPPGLLVSWYGDDFTGSAAVMEVLSFAGLPSVLFLDRPTPERLARFPGLRGIGIASTARAQTPEWMDAEMPAPLAYLAGLGAPILHWKTCSTLDSAPHIGSVGRGAELALAAAGGRAASVVIAAPQMRRYQAFGHLFAGTPAGVFRLDRHPVMARHPITPMDEADVGRHLARQTDLAMGLVDLEALADPARADARLAEVLAAGAQLVLCDVMGPESEAALGRLLWQHRAAVPVAVGSQGVEYALIRHWQAEGMLPPARPPGSAGAVDRIVVVSGSVSPITAGQIGWSLDNGFARIPLDARAACGTAADLAAAEAAAVTAGLAALERGASPLIHTAAGPDDPAVAELRRAVAISGQSMDAVNHRIGSALGRVLDAILTRSGVRRAVISGGDTSGHGTAQLGLFALSAIAPTIPGAALFRGHGDGRHDGLELALKGGQMGSEDYFGWVRAGGGPR